MRNLIVTPGLLWLIAGAARGATMVAPVVTADTTTITQDALFSNSLNHPGSSSESYLDADGFTCQHDAATAWRQGTDTYADVSRTYDNSYTFDAITRQRVMSADNDFRFDATTAVTATLDSVLTTANGYHSYIVTQFKNTTGIALSRTVQFIVDQPMELSIHLSGQTTGGSFKDIFNSLVLRGGAMRPAIDSIYNFTVTTYTASDMITFTGDRSKVGVDCSLHGTADSNGIDLILDLNPTVAGTAPAVEFSWAMNKTLLADTGIGFSNWVKDLTVAGSINESISITAVPETSPCLLAALALVIPCFSRRMARCSRP